MVFVRIRLLGHDVHVIRTVSNDNRLKLIDCGVPVDFTLPIVLKFMPLDCVLTVFQIVSQHTHGQLKKTLPFLLGDLHLFCKEILLLVVPIDCEQHCIPLALVKLLDAVVPRIRLSALLVYAFLFMVFVIIAIGSFLKIYELGHKKECQVLPTFIVHIIVQS